MKRLHIATFLLLPFFAFSMTFAQSEGVILPSDGLDDELFGDILDEEPPEIFLEDEEPVVDPLAELFDEPTTPSASLQSSNLPLTATTSLSVVNISQNNANALETGARPGDILRYEFSIDSQDDDVKEYTAQIDVSSLEGAVNFTDISLGTLNGGVLTYPEFSQQAPCNQTYTFFVQVKEDCGDVNSASVSAEDQNVRVNLNCGLAQVGPGNSFLAWGIALLLAAFGMMWVSHRRTN